MDINLLAIATAATNAAANAAFQAVCAAKFALTNQSSASAMADAEKCVAAAEEAFKALENAAPNSTICAIGRVAAESARVSLEVAKLSLILVYQHPSTSQHPGMTMGVPVAAGVGRPVTRSMTGAAGAGTSRQPVAVAGTSRQPAAGAGTSRGRPKLDYCKCCSKCDGRCGCVNAKRKCTSKCSCSKFSKCGNPSGSAYGR